MKKIIVAIAILAVGVWGASFDKALYNQALGKFQEKKYEEAYSSFSILFEENMDTILINFYLGRSAYELGEYEQALAAYERILLYEPDNTRVRAELAQTYVQMKLFTQALREFELVLANKIPQEVRNKVEARVAFLKAKEQKHFVHISLMSGLIYDSNVNAATDRGSFEIYNPYVGSNMTIQSDGKKEDALIAQLFVPLSYRYKAAQNFLIDTSVVAGSMRYNGFKHKNIDLLSTQIAPTLYIQNYKLSLGFMYDLIYLGQEKYQNNYYIKPRVSTLLSKSLLYDLALQIGEINYLKEELRSSEFYSLTNTLRYASESMGIFDFVLNLAKEEEVYSQRTDVSLFFADARVANSFEFLQSYLLRTSVLYRYTKYDEEDLNFLSKREDKRLDYSLDLQKILTDNLALNIGATVSDVSSNHKPYDYDKYNVRANISYGF